MALTTKFKISWLAYCKFDAYNLKAFFVTFLSLILINFLVRALQCTKSLSFLLILLLDYTVALIMKKSLKIEETIPILLLKTNNPDYPTN